MLRDTMLIVNPVPATSAEHVTSVSCSAVMCSSGEWSAVADCVGSSHASTWLPDTMPLCPVMATDAVSDPGTAPNGAVVDPVAPSDDEHLVDARVRSHLE